MAKQLEEYIRTIPDFPKAGIMFRDVTSLIADPVGFALAVEQLEAYAVQKRVDVIVGLEARGFIFGAALAHKMGVGFVPIRKKGKLPGATIEQAYTLEYGEAVLEMHEDALEEGARVLLIDDLLATGGTALAGASLVARLKGQIVGCGFVVDLPDLGGRRKLEAAGYDVACLCLFEGE